MKDRSAGEASVPLVESFQQLYRREFKSGVALAYVLSGSRTAAEELAQESFLSAHRQWEGVSGYDDPAAWVRRVCVNRSTSLIRRRISEARALTRWAARPVLPEELAPDANEFWHAVRRLPRRQAQVVTLHYLEDLSVADIASLLHCEAGTVKAHLFRARRTLAAQLQCERAGDEEVAEL